MKLLVLGEYMSANDYEKSLYSCWIRLDFHNSSPVQTSPFGDLFEAQLLAQALGATVATLLKKVKSKSAIKMISDPHYSEINILIRRATSIIGIPEGFEIPSSCPTRIGRYFENQAFRYGKNAYGVQFHPEMVQSTLERWQRQSKLKLPEKVQSWSESNSKPY